jgi:hypothetical protein
VDVAALSLYPVGDEAPEASYRLFRQVRRAVLDYRHVDLPVWNSEINYGITQGGAGHHPTALTPQRQAAYVVRTYLLDAAAGIKRVFWYAWDLEGTASVGLSQEGRPTAAGRALLRLQRWVDGERLLGCSRRPAGQMRGTWICRLEGQRSLHIVWNPSRTTRIRVPAGSRITDLTGSPRDVDRRSWVRVDGRPRRIVSRHW